MESTSIMGTILTAIVTGTISIIAFYIKERIKKKQECVKAIDLPLSEHPFFVRSDMIKSNIQTTFTLTNKGKEAVFKDIIYNLINVFQIELSEISKRIDKNQLLDSTELYNTHMEVLNKIIERHHNYYKDNSLYTKEEQNILDIVMRKFDLWNQYKINFLQEQIMSVCNSPFYKTEKIKAAVILDLYLGTSVDILNDAARTLNNINGDLRGFIFKNIKI
ncbi:hypothetical protein KYB31_06560 [Clostridium felsineum]|uniref:hypothetical protein n=1 Tax=Clostridium felsineum TaxID=36839 RepID=UPI00214D4429|nr:hypothetical protein [Clostridium felsineum]MCR3758656.1 hypothetical protein [Clostridium felsineum]